MSAESSQFSDQAAPGGKANVVITIRNVGYAPLYNERPVYLVLKGAGNLSSLYMIPLQADPRRWLPNGAWSLIREQVDIPEHVLEGTYHLYLWMPDKYESIQNDPRYAVRCANQNVWDENTGYNDLGAEITITSSASKDPGELPEGLNAVTAQKRSSKVVENGNVFVLTSDNRKYSVNGQMTK